MPAKNGLLVGREEDRERPAAAPAHELHDELVDLIEVGALLAIDLDADEELVHELRDRVVLEALALHDVAPVARRVADARAGSACPRASRAASASSPHGYQSTGIVVRAAAGTATPRARGDSACDAASMRSYAPCDPPSRRAMSSATTECRRRSIRRAVDGSVGAARCSTASAREIAASFPGITRLGGQIVAALYLVGRPLSMDELSEELGRSKSNIFANLRGARGRRHRRAPTRSRGSRARLVRAARASTPTSSSARTSRGCAASSLDKQDLCSRALEHARRRATATRPSALRERSTRSRRKYERFGVVFEELMPATDGPIDLEDSSTARAR